MVFTTSHHSVSEAPEHSVEHVVAVISLEPEVNVIHPQMEGEHCC